MSLKEIAAGNEERRRGRLASERRVEIMSAQLASLETKAMELKMMISNVRAKIAWLTSGQQGAAPEYFYSRRCASSRSRSPVPPLEQLKVPRGYTA